MFLVSTQMLLALGAHTHTHSPPFSSTVMVLVVLVHSSVSMLSWSN